MTPRHDGGRQPAITRDALVAAALAVLERDGLDALSMRRVAAELDVQAASLYWHVRNKEELLDLLADALLAGIDLDVPNGSWRDQLREMAGRYRAHLKARRDAVRVIGGRFVVGPNSATLMDRTLAVLRSAGFSPAGAAAGLYLVSVVYVQGFVLQETAPVRAIEANGGSSQQAMAAVAEELASLQPGAFPSLAETGDYLVTLNLDDRFAWGLEVVLDGLERRLAAERV